MSPNQRNYNENRNENRGNNNGQVTYVTRSGHQPKRELLTYPLTSADVEEFVQAQINAAILRITNESKGAVKFKNPKIEVNSSNVSQKFKPFIIVMPAEFDVKNGLQSRAPRFANDLPEIAKQAIQMGNSTNNNNKGVKLYMQIMTVLNRYTYDYQYARQLFGDPKFRRERLISEKDANQLMSIVKPRNKNVQRRGSGNTEKSIVLLFDPLAIFHDMLEIDGYQREFKSRIAKMTRLDRPTNYVYEVERIVLPKKKKKNFDGYDIFGNTVKGK